MLVNEEDPVKARAGRRPDHHPAGRRRTWRSRGGSPTKAAATSTWSINGGEFDGARPDDPRSSACATSARILEALRPGAAAGPLRDGARPGDRLRHAGARQPRRRRAADRPPGAADRGRQGGRSAARRPPLEIFAIAVAATLTLAFVTVLLVAGSLALEREENAFPRLTRGLVSPHRRCSPRRSLLGVAVGLVVTLLMLAGLADLRPAATGAGSASGWSAILARRRGARRRPGRRSGRRRARSAPSPCSPSWSPCRSPSSRWSPPARSAPAVYDAIQVRRPRSSPSSRRCEAMTAALDPAGAGIGGPLLHLAILDRRLRR